MRFDPISTYIGIADAHSICERFHLGRSTVESDSWRYDDDGNEYIDLCDDLRLTIKKSDNVYAAPTFVVSKDGVDLFTVSDVQATTVDAYAAPDMDNGQRLTVVAWLYLDAGMVWGTRVAVIADASGVM